MSEIEELFFEILSRICIIIYADNLLKPNEMVRLIEFVREREISDLQPRSALLSPGKYR